MIVLSGVLVLVALVLLVIGVLDANLPLVYASIAVSVLSLLSLLVGILQRRGEPLPATGSDAAAVDHLSQPATERSSAEVSDRTAVLAGAPPRESASPAEPGSLSTQLLGTGGPGDAAVAARMTDVDEAWDGAAPDGAAPAGAASDGAAPDGAAPDGAAPDGAASDGAAADGWAPDVAAAPGTGQARSGSRRVVPAPREHAVPEADVVGDDDHPDARDDASVSGRPAADDSVGQLGRSEQRRAAADPDDEPWDDAAGDGAASWEAQVEDEVEPTAGSTENSAGQATAEQFTDDAPDDAPDDGPGDGTGTGPGASVGSETATVLVVPGRPRYHVPGCRYLYGKSPAPVDLAQARADGFAPCGVCKPDAAVGQDGAARPATAPSLPDQRSVEHVTDDAASAPGADGPYAAADADADADARAERGPERSSPSPAPALPEGSIADGAGSPEDGGDPPEAQPWSDGQPGGPTAPTGPSRTRYRRGAAATTALGELGGRRTPSADPPAEPEAPGGQDFPGPARPSGAPDGVGGARPAPARRAKAARASSPASDAPAGRPRTGASPTGRPATSAATKAGPARPGAAKGSSTAGRAAAPAAAPAARARTTAPVRAAAASSETGRGAPVGPRPAQPGRAQPGRAQTAPAKAGPVKAGPAKAGPAKAGPARPAPVTAGPVRAPGAAAGPVRPVRANPAAVTGPATQREAQAQSSPASRPVRASPTTALRPAGSPDAPTQARPGRAARTSGRGAVAARGAVASRAAAAGQGQPPPAPSAPVARNGQVVVIPDRGRFHRAECRYVRGVAGATSLSKATAADSGYAACGVCRP